MPRFAPILSAAVLLALLAASPAQAQRYLGIGAGSTVPGDILRGEGVALWGAGKFNYYTAQANAINTSTYIMLNEYIYQSLQTQKREAIARMKARDAHCKQMYVDMLAKIRDNPDYRDLYQGDALNSKLVELLDPNRFPGSSMSLSPVSLNASVVRAIPFSIAREGVTVSLRRLSTHGRWPVVLRDPTFAREVKAYERAIDEAIEQQLEGKMSNQAVQAVDDAARTLRIKLDQVVLDKDDTRYREALTHVHRLERATELLKRKEVERIVGELDKYAGSTVEDLIRFMGKNGLQFAAADYGDERDAYPALFASLSTQLKQAPKDGGGDDSR